MKKTPLIVLIPCLLLAVLAPAILGQTGDKTGGATGLTLSISNTTTGLGTRETVTREVDGLPITYPVDEADVVELLLPRIAEYRALRRVRAKAEADELIAALAGSQFRERYRMVVPKLLGAEPAPEKEFDARYDAVLAADVAPFYRQWEKWSGDLSRVNIWNRALGGQFIKEGRIVFPQITYAAGPEDNTEFTLAAGYLKQAVGVDFLRKTNEQAPAVEPLQLDLPLFYAPGADAKSVAQGRGGLLAELPHTMEKFAVALLPAAQQGVTEALLEAELRARFFNPAAVATPEGALLLRTLARYYLLVQLKTAGTTPDDPATLLAKLFFFDLPETPEARADFLRDFEALDPFSEEGQKKMRASPLLAVAGSRIAAFTLVHLAQGGEEQGRPFLQKLRAAHLLPEGGFATVAGFRQTLEAAYPGQVETNLRDARGKLATAARARAVTPEPQKAGIAATPEPELPDRHTQVVAGITVTSPASLAGAAARLAPEWAARMAKARARIDERFAEPASPPVPATDPTLEMLRAQGLAVTRTKADQFALQASFLANAGQMLKALYHGKAIQVWFKSDLKKLLIEGRHVPGFSYEAAGDVVHFQFGGQSHFTVDGAKPMTVQGMLDSLLNVAPPIYPIVLKDDGIAQLTEPEEQAAKMREGDRFLASVMEAAGTISPAQAGLEENSLFHGRLLTPAQALFSSVHELVEDELVSRTIASPDRRWFCEGVANLLALRACEAQFGQEKGAAATVFASLYDPATLSRRASEVDLLAWAAEESKPAQGKKDDELAQAHYYYATRVLMAATAGKNAEFLKDWLAKIRETKWNRTNAGTVIGAYDELAGQSLRELIKKTTAAEPAPSK